MNTDEIRKDYIGKSQGWVENRLFEALAEIDRLEQRERDGVFAVKVLATEHKKQVEQCTKEACFNAGFKWVLAHMPSHGLTHGASEESFKQAIDSAKING